MLIGYAWVNKRDDHGTAAQQKALRDVRCKQVFVETAGSGLWNRRVLHLWLIACSRVAAS